MERYDILENFGQLSIDRYRFTLLKYYIVDSTNIYYKLWWAWKGETNNFLSPWKNIAYYTISIKRRQIFIALYVVKEKHIPNRTQNSNSYSRKFKTYFNPVKSTKLSVPTKKIRSLCYCRTLNEHPPLCLFMHQIALTIVTIPHISVNVKLHSHKLESIILKNNHSISQT